MYSQNSTFLRVLTNFHPKITYSNRINKHKKLFTAFFRGFSKGLTLGLSRIDKEIEIKNAITHMFEPVGKNEMLTAIFRKESNQIKLILDQFLQRFNVRDEDLKKKFQYALPIIKQLFHLNEDQLGPVNLNVFNQIMETFKASKKID